MSTNSYDISAQTVKDLAAARQKTNFDTKKMALAIFGKDMFDQHERIINILRSDPVCKREPKPFLNHTQAVQRGLSVSKRLLELKEKHGWSYPDFRMAQQLAGPGLSVSTRL